MDILFWVLVIGFIGYLIGKSRAESDLRAKIKKELSEFAGQQKDPEIAKGIEAAGKFISPEFVPTTPATTETSFTPYSPEPTTVTEPITRAVAAAESYQPPQTTVAEHKVPKPMDSVSVLLYFGAFLMIAGVGLFVGLSDFNGFVKTVAVLILAGTFYAGGLYLYRDFKKLQPVGITLTAIGLICLPLIGVTAYTYLNGNLSASVTWFVTSAICLCLYVYAIWAIRQSFIGYLSVFMCLSLWMSVVSIFNAPVYFFGWAAVILSMIYLLAAKRWKLWREVEAPLTVSATVMVPTSLVIVLLFSAGHISQLHQGITVLLAAAFYGMVCWLSSRDDEKLNSFTIANVLLALGTALVAHDVSKSLTITAFWLSIVSAAQLGAVIFYKKDLPKTWTNSISWLSAVSMFIAACIAAMSGDWIIVSWLIGWQIAVHTAAAWYLRATVHMALGLLDVLVLPFMVGFMAITPTLGSDVVAPIYLAIGLGLMVLARRVRSAAPSYRQLTIVAYVSAWVIAWLIGNMGAVDGSPNWLPTATTLSIVGAAILSAYYEKRAAILYCGTIALFYGVFQWLLLESLSTNYFAVALTIGSAGLAMYGLGKWQQRTPKLSEYWQPWAWSGLAFLYLGSIYSILGAWFTPTQTLWAGAVCLFVAGAITSYESYKMKDKTGIYFGYAVIIAAIQFKMHQIGIREWQIYWYMWAAYPMIIAYIESAPTAIYFGTVLALIGLGQGIAQHSITDTVLISMLFVLLAAAYYGLGKIHEFMLGNEYKKLGTAWTISGISALYFVSILPNWWLYATGGALVNALALMAAGATTSYEAYRKNSRAGLYIGGGVSLLGLQWLMHMNNIQDFQIYSHMWALYFALLAWLGHNDGRQNEKTGFTITALIIQTLPLASQALAGDTGYGLLLLVESVAIMAFGLYIRYKLVSQWGLIVAVISVLYQLRDYQFFTLVLLGAGVIGFGVYMLMRGEKTKS